MPDHPRHSWAFASRFRAGAYGPRASKLACQRVREATAEIAKVAQRQPSLGAEGAVRFLERVAPALEHVDSSSGALGTAVNRALARLIPLIASCTVDERTRTNWLDRLWRAYENDGLGQLEPVAERWGELCGSVDAASAWADKLWPGLRAHWRSREAAKYFRSASACLSCLEHAERYQELLTLLRLAPYAVWHYRQYGVRALLALGRKRDALHYAEASRGFNQPDGVIDRVCEQIYLSSGLHEEAYRRYALKGVEGQSYLARFRSVAARYPMKERAEILSDLIATTPGQEGKWFAAAKEVALYDLALDLAHRSPCDPRTLIRAARDHVDSQPEFALEAALCALHWLSRGWGYEITSTEVLQAHDFAMAAADALGRNSDTEERIVAVINGADSEAAKFVRKCLAGYLRPRASKRRVRLPPK